MVLFRTVWSYNCTGLHYSQPPFTSCGIYSELAGVSKINTQSMILHEITQTSAFYKALGIVAHKNVFISSWTTPWKQSLTDCFYRKIASRGNTPHQTERHENVLPLSTGSWAPLQLRSQRCPCCWMSPQLWASLEDVKMQVATACFWS